MKTYFLVSLKLVRGLNRMGDPFYPRGPILPSAAHFISHHPLINPGKQIVVGTKDGTLTQFTPELVEKKRIEAPPGITTITDVFWHSTTLFLASYMTPDDDQVGTLLVFLDICLSLKFAVIS